MGTAKAEDVDGFGGSYMELLFKVEDDHTKYDRQRKKKAEEKGSVFFPPNHRLSACPSPEVQMLCFGSEYDECCGFTLDFLPLTPRERSLYTSTPLVANREPMAQMEEEAMPAIGRGNGRRSVSGCCRKRKRAKAETSPASMGGKAKMGTHIKALQQLIPPMGKSDMASVLDEALGYIRFLLDQVQALSSACVEVKETESAEAEEERLALSLRRRGLCLVPLYILQ